jgi:flagellar hook-associated protein 2
MSTSGISIGSTGSAPITFSGLASGLNTSSIISALMNVEREPVTHLGTGQAKLEASRSELQSVQSSLQSLSLSVSEFALPSLFESKQTVTSNEPTRVSASAAGGAAIGGYEVEVTRLANAAQRTFAFTSPKSEQKITIEGEELTIKAGESAKELADAINSNAKAAVYAAALQNGTIVLSSRTTGASGGEFIKVSAAGVLEEQQGTAKEGVDAEYKIDGVEGSSSSNTVTEAIPGVTLTLGGLTPGGPVTINVQPPGPSASAIEAQIQSFVKLYNSTVEGLQKQLSTKPPAKPSSFEYGIGTLFADTELTGVVDNMRASMYEPIEGLQAGMNSLADIGISTGAPTGSTSTQSSLEGVLTVDSSKLSEAIATNPAGVQKVLEQWSVKLQTVIDDASGAGGSLETRINGDTSQITQLTSQIASMNELLAQREKALQETYAHLEAVISQLNTQSSYLTEQSELLTSGSTSSGKG